MKSTQATVRQRVEEVLDLRLAGAEFHNIRKYANEPEPDSGRQPWNVSDSQLWRYIRQGDELLAETLEQDRGKLLNRHLAQRRHLLARCLQQNDLSNARALLADEAKLLDLYPATKTELTGKGGGAIPVQVQVQHEYEQLRKLPPDELQRLYREALGAPRNGQPRPPPSGA